MIKFLAVASIAAAAIAAPASAVLVYNAPLNTAGNQAYDKTVAMNFSVNTATTFNLLGVFDAGSNGIIGPVSVGVYNATTQLFVSPVVTFTNFANSSAYATQRVTPFLLAAGNYQLAAWGFSGTDNNYNSIFTANHPTSAITFGSLGGRLTATSVAYSVGTPGDFATIMEQSATRYGAGTLGIVPEPATWAMMLSGFGMIGFAMRRRNTALLSA